MKRKWLEDIDGWKNLKYLRLKGVPVRRSTQGFLLDIKEEALERIIARVVVEQRIPISGTEVKFLRNVLGISLHEFGRRLGLTGTAVFHWEAAPKARLHLINEVAVRGLCAEELGVPISGWLSSLLGQERTEVEILVTPPKNVKRRDAQLPDPGGPPKRAKAPRNDFVPAWVVRQKARRAKANGGK